MLAVKKPWKLCEGSNFLKRPAFRLCRTIWDILRTPLFKQNIFRRLLLEIYEKKFVSWFTINQYSKNSYHLHCKQIDWFLYDTSFYQKMFTKRIQELFDFLKTSSFQVLIQKCVIFVSLLFLGKPAWAAFRNLHIKFSRKIKLRALQKSGSRAINLKLSELFSLLTWSEPYVFERETISNYEEDQDKPYETGQELERDGIENLCCRVREVPNFCCYKKKSLSQKRQQTSGKTCRRKVEVNKEIKINSITTS